MLRNRKLEDEQDIDSQMVYGPKVVKPSDIDQGRLAFIAMQNPAILEWVKAQEKKLRESEQNYN